MTEPTREELAELRENLPRNDPILRSLDVAEFARARRRHVADVERSLAELPAPAALTRDQRDARQLADLRAARDDAGRRGYPETVSKLDTHLQIVEDELGRRRHRLTARAILAGMKDRYRTADDRMWRRAGDHLVDDLDVEAVVADLAAAAADVAALRRQVSGGTVASTRMLQDGEVLRVPRR